MQDSYKIRNLENKNHKRVQKYLFGKNANHTRGKPYLYEQVNNAWAALEANGALLGQPFQ